MVYALPGGKSQCSDHELDAIHHLGNIRHRPSVAIFLAHRSSKGGQRFATGRFWVIGANRLGGMIVMRAGGLRA
jgi:hypothetical protein